jgi:hypothetical protein
VGELGQGGGLGCRVVGGNLANVCENVTLQKTALGAGGWDLGDIGLGDALLAEELGDRGVERIGGVLGLR